MDAELVDEDLPAAAVHSALLEVDARPLQLRLLLVGGIDVRDRPLAGPLGRAGRARGRTRSPPCRRRPRRPGRGRSRTTTRAARTRGSRPSVSIRIRPFSRTRRPGPGMRVQVRDAARREVDPVAAQEPVALPRPLGQLPHERVPVDVGGAVVRLVALDVVDDAVAWLGRDSVRMLGQARGSMEVLAAVDHDRLPGDEVRARAAEVDDGADDVLRQLVALDRRAR